MMIRNLPKNSPAVPWAVVLTLLFVVLICTAASSSFVEGQAMGFESESSSCKFIKPTSNNAAWTEFTYGNNPKVVLKKGYPVDVPQPYPNADWNNPQVHPTFEIIDLHNLPVEFVSDPIPFAKGANFICEMNSKLKSYFDKIYSEQANSFVHKFFKDRGVALTEKKGVVTQALQITYSFPYEKAMLSLRTLVTFLFNREPVPNQPQEPRWVKKMDLVFLKSLINFLDTDNTIKVQPDNVKLFYFFIFQYFAVGSMEKDCTLSNYAKTISGIVLLRTNMYEFISHGGQQSVKTLLGNNALNNVISGYERFLKIFNKIPDQNRALAPKISLCADKVNCINACFTGAQTKYFFARKYELNKKFPFTANEYIAALFRPNGEDLFVTNGNEFDNAFGRFPLNVANKPTVIYELRSLDGFEYSSKEQMLLRDQARKIPTYFNLALEIMKSNAVADMDLGVKMCANGVLTPFDAKTVIPAPVVAAPAPQQPQPQQQQAVVHEKRVERRAVNAAIQEKRVERRKSESDLKVAPPKAPVPVKKNVPKKAKEVVAAAALFNDNNAGAESLDNILGGTPLQENMSLLREERRKIRVQKRLNRENRRKQQVEKNLPQGATEKQVRREALRLAREKKRLAREEERDIAAGIKPVSKQELSQIIQKELKKKKHHIGGIKHSIVENKNGVNVQIKLRLY